MRAPFDQRQRPFLGTANTCQLFLQRRDAIEQEHQLRVCGTVQPLGGGLAFAHDGALFRRRSAQNGMPLSTMSPASSTASIRTRSRVSADFPAVWVIRHT